MKRMLDAADLPDLTFSDVELGSRESAWDLACLLYRGGAAANARKVRQMIPEGKLGSPIHERIELVVKIHEAIVAKMAKGGSTSTGVNLISAMRKLFAWADANNTSLTLATVEQTYLIWTDWLLHRHRVHKNLNMNSAYTHGSHASIVLDEVLQRDLPLISATRLQSQTWQKSGRGATAEKQSLTETFSFGHLLQDVCDALTVDAVLNGPVPVKIPLRNGGEIVDWCGYPHSKLFQYQPEYEPPKSESGILRRQWRNCMKKYRAWVAEGTLKTRYPLANRRCEAELLMFIAQTGMNLAQAHKMQLRQFYFASHLDGYQVRDRKNRRGGDVLFEVFSEYRPHFERYLEWRRTVFPNSDALFPLVRKHGRSFTKHPQFGLRRTCASVGIKFVPPQTLRNTRVNWLLRHSGDAAQTAEMAQHSKETLLTVYERPSEHRALSETARFWAQNDPTIAKTTPPAPGLCNGEPIPLKDLPSKVAPPDCLRPSGCLWCEHHRDIDSQDHVWALACFRHLKIIEVSTWTPPVNSREIHPAQHAVDKLSAKLNWFRDSNSKRKSWVEEALCRVEEGNYHPSWVRRINAFEGAA